MPFIYLYICTCQLAEQQSLHVPCMLPDNVCLCPCKSVGEFSLVWPQVLNFSFFCLILFPSLQLAAVQPLSRPQSGSASVSHLRGRGTWTKRADKSGKAEHMKKRYGLNYV